MRDVTKQKHMFHNQRNNHLLEICPPVINMKELSGKDFKTVNMNMFKDIKEKKIYTPIIRKNDCNGEIEDINRIIMGHTDEKLSI